MPALSSSSMLARALRNMPLILISLALLPLDLYLLTCAYVLQIMHPYNARREARKKPAFTPKTILITGLGTTKGVAMARMFYQAGHDVIGAETAPGYFSWPWGRLSRSLKKFYSLPSPAASSNTDKVRSESYFAAVRWIIREKKASHWISCSEGVPATFDAELAAMITKDTVCKAIHFDETTTRALSKVDSLTEYLNSAGLPVPDSHSVWSRNQIHQVLKIDRSPSPKPYIIRKSSESLTEVRNPKKERIRLPKRTVSETYEAVAKVPVNAENPYLLQEEVLGKQYSTHALVVASEIQTFVAFEVSSAMTYKSLPADSILARAMLRYTQEFSRRSSANLTGHVSFKFVVDEHATEKGTVQLLFALECKPRVTTGCILLSGREREVAARYLHAGAIHHLSNGFSYFPQPPVVPKGHQGFYWIGHDISTLICSSIFKCLTFQMGLKQCASDLATFVHHLVFWKEATFEMWDPLPSFWLYHVSWPLFLLRDIWSRPAAVSGS